MEQVRSWRDGLQVFETPRAYRKGTKFLIVEDDIGIQQIWERIIDNIDPDAMIRWATTEEGAERLMRDRARLGDEFDVVVADIMLGGTKTGIDLWREHQGSAPRFLFTSGITKKKFKEMIGSHEGELPLLIQKPLNPNDCISCIRQMLELA